MNLKNFILKLENIRKKHGDNIEIIMADDIPMVAPVFSIKYPGGEKVIITDKN